MISVGDYVSQSENISNLEQDIEFRCETVSEVVAEKIFPLEKALGIYNVTFRQYLGYLLLRNESKITIDGDTVVNFLTVMFDAMDISEPHLGKKAGKVISDLRELSSV